MILLQPEDSETRNLFLYFTKTRHKSQMQIHIKQQKFAQK